MKFEVCHSAPAHFKTMRGFMHDYKQIREGRKTEREKKNSLMARKIILVFLVGWTDKAVSMFIHSNADKIV